MKSINIKICSKENNEVVGTVRCTVEGKIVRVNENEIMSSGVYNTSIEEVGRYAIGGVNRTYGISKNKLYIQ